MPVEIQEKAFEPLFTTNPHGSGIGLPSVYGTMRSVGGTVRIASLAGEGTTVWLLMPAADVPGTAPAGDSQRRPAARPGGRSGPG
jgi:signal transduction histidine kinase